MKKRVFISFAEANSNLKSILISQAKNNDWPYDFVFFDDKKPWSKSWKDECMKTIDNCDCMIVIVTKETMRDRGQLHEVKCAKKVVIPTKGFYGSASSKPIRLSSKLSFVNIIPWDWDKIRNWIGNV